MISHLSKANQLEENGHHFNKIPIHSLIDLLNVLNACNVPHAETKNMICMCAQSLQ